MTGIKREPSKGAKKLVAEAVQATKDARSYIRHRASTRKKAILVLLNEGFSLRDIGEMLGITGQRVGALVRYWGLR